MNTIKIQEKDISNSNTCINDKKRDINGNFDNTLDNGTGPCQIKWTLLGI